MYTKLKFGLIALLLTLLALFNFTVDPYGIYLSDTGPEFSRRKTEFFMKEPVIKPNRVSDVRPDTLILGLSGAGLGYDETHTGFADKTVYNFSMAGVSMYMIYRAFQHALATGELDTVLLDLRLFAFNDQHQMATPERMGAGGSAFEYLIAVNEDGGRNWRAPLRHVTNTPQLLLSYSATLDSIATLRKQGDFEGWYLNSSGGWHGSTLAPDQSQRKRFLKTQRLLFDGFFEQGSDGESFSIYRADGELSRAFEYFQRLLEDAHRNDVNLVLVLSPSHAYFYAALEHLGLSAMHTEWKRRLVAINEEVAMEQAGEPFPLWDFAYYSDVAIEPVPAPGDRGARMTWHFDPVHFRRAAGNLVLDQVLLGREGPGMQLTGASIDRQLDVQEEARLRYYRDNPGVARQLEGMYRRITRNAPRGSSR